MSVLGLAGVEEERLMGGAEGAGCCGLANSEPVLRSEPVLSWFHSRRRRGGSFEGNEVRLRGKERGL